MVQLYLGHHQFSMVGKGDRVIEEITKQHIINQDRHLTTRQEMEGTVVLHKIIHHSRIMALQDKHHGRIMAHQDKEKEEILCP